MRLTIDELRYRYNNEPKQSAHSLEFIVEESTNKIRGGDKEYNPPLYEQKHQSFWQRASMLLDNMK